VRWSVAAGQYGSGVDAGLYTFTATQIETYETYLVA